MEKWETWFWFSTFPSHLCGSGGNVEISRRWRDFQGAVERVEILLLDFRAFHRSGISTARLMLPLCAVVSFDGNRPATGDRPWAARASAAAVSSAWGSA